MLIVTKNFFWQAQFYLYYLLSKFCPVLCPMWVREYLFHSTTHPKGCIL